jgi:DNA-binding response OmpR family regulator
MKRVLVVDDDVAIREAITELLDQSFELSTAGNGAEALALFDHSTFDAIVLDLMMPVLDGRAFKKALDERGIRVPVVVVSASTDLSKSAREMGVDEWLSKPFDINDLEAALTKVLSGPSGAGSAGAATSGSGEPDTGEKTPSSDRSARRRSSRSRAVVLHA